MDVPPTNPPGASQWTRSVQLVFAFILGAILTLLVGNYFSFFARPRPTDRERIVVVTSIDVNRASKAELMQLPGVGDSLADDILAVRAERGGFQSADKLQQVRGIGPKRLEALRPYVRFDNATARDPDLPPSSSAKKISAGDAKIDINRAAKSELQMLPGIGPVLAERIIQTRDKEPFRKIEDLRRVSGIGPTTFEKLKPFITCGPPLELVAGAEQDGV